MGSDRPTHSGLTIAVYANRKRTWLYKGTWQVFI